MNKKALAFCAAYLTVMAALYFITAADSTVVETPQDRPPAPVIVQPEPVKPSFGPYNIQVRTLDRYYSHPEVVNLMKCWHEEAPDITEFGTYGKNRQGTELNYLRIGTPGKPKILIHACIHGNERLCAAATLSMMGNMLHDYKRNEDVTWIVENREVFFVPVFSPESYLRSRHIEQGDPNRNWPYPGSSTNNTSSPIVAMRDFFEKEKFCAVIDGHTTGRDFFWPSIARGEDRNEYQKLATDMARLAGYSPSAISSRPAGFAIDWYYWKGAVAILTEFGVGSHDQPRSAIEPEFKKTYPAYLHFMKAAPDIKLQGVSAQNVFYPTRLRRIDLGNNKRRPIGWLE